MPWLRVPRRRDGPTVAKDKYKTGKSQDPPTKHQLQAVKERTKEHDVAEAAHQDPDYWHSAPEDEEKTAQLAKAPSNYHPHRPHRAHLHTHVTRLGSRLKIIFVDSSAARGSSQISPYP